ncbi:MAG: hypothetical protein CMC79_04350 [Flavobacteriaceae bacterium]|nr:hypothetical protein [Flavobacteriaceae bacterium]|tara:strand:+ start:4357 stop:5247 length:891 start_codon:yes stop_codon:yes gene_type:complete
MEPFRIKTKYETGNPIAYFLLNKSLNIDKSKVYNNIDEAQEIPIVKKLFYLPFVKSVRITPQSIEIEKFNILEWNEVVEEVENQLINDLNDEEMTLETQSFKNNKTPLTIYAESTPNPSVMKFVCNQKLVEETIEYKNIKEANGASLAQDLFNFPFIKEIFISENYISLTKIDSTKWDAIVLELREFILDGLNKDKGLVNSFSKKSLQTKGKISKNTNIEKKIISILDEYIKPAVASDGGNIVFESYLEEKKIVNVVLQGACSGCPSSTLTLKNGIETMLKQMIPGKINVVNAING